MMNKKLALLTTLTITGLLLAGTTASVLAAGITQEDAQKTALAAAKLKEEDVIFSKLEKGFDDGVEIFEIDFIIPGETKYEFDIDAATGAILDQGTEMWEKEDDFEYAALIEESKSGKKAAASGEITEKKAKEIALKDAGVKESDTLFINCRKDMDDGVARFEVEFRTADGMEYDYDIQIDTGKILERNAEMDD